MRDVIGPVGTYFLARFILLPGIFIFVGFAIFAQGVLLAGRSGVFEFEVLGIFAAFVGIVGIVSAILYAIFLERINKFFTIVSVIEIVIILIMHFLPIRNAFSSAIYQCVGCLAEDGMWVLIIFPIGFLFIRAFPGILRRR